MNDHEMKKSPSDQVTRNKHLLLNRLKRVRFGPIFMPSYVRKGQWIELDDKSLSDVLSAVDLSVRKKQRQQAPQDKKRWDRQLKRLRSRGPSSR